LAPKNLATVLTWVHYRGVLVLALLVAGNLFCMACPFMLPRNLARRFFQPTRFWPRRLRGKWVAVVLFALLLFAYELFDLWATPWWTAWLIVAYFAGALLVDGLFRGAPFCKYVCPIGQFNFVASLSSPLEIKVRDPQICTTCHTKDCIKGRPDPNLQSPTLRGCELWLFQQRKVGNMDCTFCLDCIHACPHDNVGVLTRLPAAELVSDPLRSGIGRFSRRPDLAALVILFTFGALLNAFGMVSPVYQLQSWLADLLGTQAEPPVLGIIFLVGLVVEPLLLLGLAAWLARRWAGLQKDLLSVVTRYAYALAPLGFGVWIAHYAFHFLTGFWTFVPVIQGALADLGWPVLGTPRWDLGPLLPSTWLLPLEQIIMAVGWLISLLVAYRLASEDAPERPWRAFLPWAGLTFLLLIAANWLMGQPMEMRGTFLG
jgi:ferredoxin